MNIEIKIKRLKNLDKLKLFNFQYEPNNYNKILVSCKFVIICIDYDYELIRKFLNHFYKNLNKSLKEVNNLLLNEKEINNHLLYLKEELEKEINKQNKKNKFKIEGVSEKGDLYLEHRIKEIKHNKAMEKFKKNNPYNVDFFIFHNKDILKKYLPIEDYNYLTSYIGSNIFHNYLDGYGGRIFNYVFYILKEISKKGYDDFYNFLIELNNKEPDNFLKENIENLGKYLFKEKLESKLQTKGITEKRIKI